MLHSCSFLVDTRFIHTEEPTATGTKPSSAQPGGGKGIHDVIVNFILHFHRSYRAGNLFDLVSIYENGFPRLSEKFYAKGPWPTAEAITPLIKDDG